MLTNFYGTKEQKNTLDELLDFFIDDTTDTINLYQKILNKSNDLEIAVNQIFYDDFIERKKRVELFDEVLAKIEHKILKDTGKIRIIDV